MLPGHQPAIIGSSLNTTDASAADLGRSAKPRLTRVARENHFVSDGEPGSLSISLAHLHVHAMRQMVVSPAGESLRNVNGTGAQEHALGKAGLSAC